MATSRYDPTLALRSVVAPDSSARRTSESWLAWVWASMNPGSTNLPLTSSVSMPAGGVWEPDREDPAVADQHVRPGHGPGADVEDRAPDQRQAGLLGSRGKRQDQRQGGKDETHSQEPPGRARYQRPPDAGGLGYPRFAVHR